MRCPHCQQSNSCRRTGRVGIYPTPVAILALSYGFALLWTFGRPWEWRCDKCGHEFVRHSSVTRIFRILAWVVGMFTVLFLAVILFGITTAIMMEMLG